MDTRPGASASWSEYIRIDRIDNVGPNTTRLTQVNKDVHTILTPSETIAQFDYLAHQGNGGIDAIVATTIRIIIYQPKQRLSVAWEDIRDMTIDDGSQLAALRLTMPDSRTLPLGGLLLEQAHALLATYQRAIRSSYLRDTELEVQEIRSTRFETGCHTNDECGEDIASLEQRLRGEQEFLNLQEELGDGIKKRIETEDRIADLQQKLNARYEERRREVNAHDLEDFIVDVEYEEDEADYDETHHGDAPGPAVDLEAMQPDEFEDLVARLYKQMGYDVDLTQHSRDGGVDVYARRTNEAGIEEIAVQCKHYTRSGPIGPAEARALLGVVNDQKRLARGVLVTSGSFSTGCQEFADRNRIGLIDGERLRELLEHHEVR